jgi:hypothetical protein
MAPRLSLATVEGRNRARRIGGAARAADAFQWKCQRSAEQWQSRAVGLELSHDVRGPTDGRHGTRVRCRWRPHSADGSFSDSTALAVRSEVGQCISA